MSHNPDFLHIAFSPVIVDNKKDSGAMTLGNQSSPLLKHDGEVKTKI